MSHLNESWQKNNSNTDLSKSGRSMSKYLPKSNNILWEHLPKTFKLILIRRSIWPIKHKIWVRFWKPAWARNIHNPLKCLKNIFFRKSAKYESYLWLNSFQEIPAMKFPRNPIKLYIYRIQNGWFSRKPVFNHGNFQTQKTTMILIFGREIW